MQLKNVFDIFRKKVAKESATTIEIPECDRTQSTSTVSNSNIIVPGGGWEPVGCDEDGNYIVVSRKTGRLVRFCPQNLNDKNLRAKVGNDYCVEHYLAQDPLTKKAVIDYRGLAEDIVCSCDDRGLFDKNAVRTTGFHREGGELIVHYGSEVCTATGSGIDITPTSRRVYVAGPKMDISVATPCASDADMQKVPEVLSTFCLTPAHQILLTGWYGLTSFGSAVPHRPIAKLPAEFGSGKTTLVQFMVGLHGTQALRRDGIPTLAQVIRAMPDRPRTLYCDEVEARASNRKVMEDFEEVSRIAFTSSDDEGIVRVIGGKTRGFHAPDGVFIAGIGLPEFNLATESRAVTFPLGKLSDEANRNPHWLLRPGSKSKVLELGQRIRRRLLTRWPIMRDSLGVFREVLVDVGHTARHADKYAALLAGYWTFTNERLPSSDEVRGLLQQTALDSVAGEFVEKAYEVCLNTLLGSNMVVHVDVAGNRVKASQSFGEVVRNIITGPAENRVSLASQLEDYGIRVDWREGVWKLMVCSSGIHPRLSHIFRETDVARGGWKSVLLRIPGAIETVQRIGAGQRAQRAVMFDVPDYLKEPDSDSDFHFPDDRDAA